MTAPNVRRFFFPTLRAHHAPGVVVLAESAVRHARVLRVQPSDVIELFDGTGFAAEASVLRLAATSLDCVLETDPCFVEDETTRDAPVHLVLGVPKGDKLESIVRMATEVGVAEIHLAITERTIARPDESRFSARQTRLARIAEEASRQSERATVPLLHAPAPLDEVVRRAMPKTQKLIAFERATESLDAALWARVPTWLVVGPEGGFSTDEVKSLVSIGYERISLGATILRVETAAVVGVALVRAALAGKPMLQQD